MQQESSKNIELQQRALDLMQEALQLIDTSETSSEVGAHLDLAMCRLKALIPVNDFDNPWKSCRPEQNAGKVSPHRF